MSFLSAGLISENNEGRRRSGGGLLGVIAGFVLVFVLVAILSFIRIAMPRHGQFNHNYLSPVQQEHIRVTPDERDQFMRREVFWRFEGPAGSHIQFRRPGCLK